jgi:hypothetical protein
MDHMTSWQQAWELRQTNTIINTAPNIALNPPFVENHPLSKSSGFHPF